MFSYWNYGRLRPLGKVTNRKETENEKLCKVRAIFDQYNLISALHTFLGKRESFYNNILPPLSILNEEKKEKLILELNSIDFKL